MSKSKNVMQVICMTLPCLMFIYLVYLLVTAVDSAVESRMAERALFQQQMKEFPPLAMALFDRVDTDHDGLLHEEELREHDLDGKFTGKDKEVVHFLYVNCKQVGHQVGNYRSGKFTYGVFAISRGDLKRAPAASVERDIR